MIAEPRCSKRRCKHLTGVRQIEDGDESKGEVPVCAAFPDGDGIPDEIAYGSNLHTTPFPGDHGIQYEREDG